MGLLFCHGAKGFLLLVFLGNGTWLVGLLVTKCATVYIINHQISQWQNSFVIAGL